MSSLYKSKTEEFIYFLIRSVFFISIVLLLNERCARSSGAYEKRDFQLEQLGILGVPNTAINIYENESDYGPSSLGGRVTFSYESSLSKDEIIKYYTLRTAKNDWKEAGVSRVENHADKELEIHRWSQGIHCFSLTFTEDELHAFYVGITWYRERRACR